MRQFQISVWQEDEGFIAQCLDVDVASQGDTEEEAIEMLKDALRLHFAPPTAEVVPKLATIEVEVGAA